MKFPLILTGIISLLVPVWIFLVAPHLLAIPSTFAYQANVASLDNFYDATKKDYTGEKRSLTKFSYSTEAEKNGVLTIKNTFDVRTLTGTPIFSVNRLYGVDALTGKHVAGAGDRDRDGYLFAPRNLTKGEPFTYWHINYDAPAHMVFVAEENISGLPVYHYETRYEGTRVDQTKNLTSLPDVGTTRGVVVEPHLEVWVEPVSGHLVKYRDDTVAYYYDLKTGEKIEPWNHFSNTFTLQSVLDHAAIAKQEKNAIANIQVRVPIGFGVLALIALVFAFRTRLSKTLLWILVGAICLGGAAWLVGLPDHPVSRVSYSGPTTTVRFGLLNIPAAAPILVALDAGYFKQQGIVLDAQLFDSGKAALAAMLQNQNIDMVIVAQTPVVTNSFSRSDFAIISGISRSANDNKILARTDRGISVPEDLRGKKIGVTKGTTGHYSLGLFLAEHRIELSDVTLIDLPAPQLVDALNLGTVDAISTWEPNIYNAQQKLGAGATLLPTKGTFASDYYLVVRKDWALTNSAAIERLLTAVDEANDFIATSPAEAERITGSHAGLDPQFLKSAWNDYRFQLFLDQSVLLGLEQQARWARLVNATSTGEVPDYLNLVYFDPLEAAKPAAITVIR